MNAIVIDMDMLEDSQYKSTFELAFNVNRDWDIVDEDTTPFYVNKLKSKGVTDPAIVDNLQLNYSVMRKEDYLNMLPLVVSSKKSILIKAPDTMDELIKYLGYTDYEYQDYEN